jgi:hypothetical protein
LILATWLPVSNGRMYQERLEVDRTPAQTPTQTIGIHSFYLCSGSMRQIGHYN